MTRLSWGLLALLLAFHAGAAQAGQVLEGHRRPAMVQAPWVSDVPAGARLRLAVGFPLRDPDQLKSLLAQIYDPKSPQYHHFLKSQDFNRRFGLNDADYGKAVAFFNARGLKVLSDASRRVTLELEGTAADVQSVFHTRLRNYRHPQGGTFFGPDGDPSVDLDLPIRHVAGLDNFARPRPDLRPQPMAAVPAGAGAKAMAMGPLGPQPQAAGPAPLSSGGSGYYGLFAGNDFRHAYAPCSSLDGSGQAVALVEFSNYYPGDVSAYLAYSNGFNGFSQGPASAINNIYLDGVTPSTAPIGLDYYLEVALDIDLTVSMVPNAVVNVYLGQDPDSVLSRVADDDSASQISCSWLWTPDAAESAIFQQFAAQGQSFLQASGDGGALQADPADNRDEPLLTLVGGTSLNLAGGAWASETAWNDNPWTSSGGIFPSQPIPGYQQGVATGLNQASTVFRNGPDVAAVANGIFQVDSSLGQIYEVIGTSCAAPIWAGTLALANQQAAAAGEAPIGFANPALYRIAQDASLGASAFHDIVVGNNLSTGPIGYNAVTGYDLVTGWGSPNCTLASDLAAGPRDTPTVTGTVSPSFTASATASPSPSFTASPSPSASASPTASPTPSPSASATASPSASPTASASASATPRPSATATASATRAPSPLPTAVPTAPGVPCALLGSAIIGNRPAGNPNGTVIINASTLVDSYNSGLGAYGAALPGGGVNVSAHGNIVSAAGIIINSNPNGVQGSVTLNTPLNLPLIQPPAGAANKGSVLVAQGQTLTLAAGDYVFGDLQVQLGGTLKVSGPVRIWVTGTALLAGAINNAGSPCDLQFYLTGSNDLNMNAQSAVYALIYAPAAVVNVDQVLFGSVVGANVTVNSPAKVHLDLACQAACLPPTATATPTRSRTATASPTPTGSRSVTASPTPTATRTASASPSPTASPSPSATVSATATPSASPSPTATDTQTAGPTATVTFTPTATLTFTPRELPLQATPLSDSAAALKASPTATPVPGGLRLAPNPASGRAQVAYQLDQAGQATLMLADLGGATALRQALGWQAAGGHQATLELAGLPDGIYIAVLLLDSGQGARVQARFKLAVLH